MSTAPTNHAYFSKGDGFYTPLGVVVSDEKPLPAAQLSPKIISAATSQTIDQALSKVQTVRTYSAVDKIIAIGVSLFFIGAIAILVYFNAHPVRYKSTGLEGFTLKSVLAEKPELSDATPATKRIVSIAKPNRYIKKPAVKNKLVDDYILSIQPKKNDANQLAVTEPIGDKSTPTASAAASHQINLKQETAIAVHNTNAAVATPKPAEKITQKNTKSDKTSTEKASLEKTSTDKANSNEDSLLVKLVDGITEHGVSEPMCTEAMRALNQCR